MRPRRRRRVSIVNASSSHNTPFLYIFVRPLGPSGPRQNLFFPLRWCPTEPAAACTQTNKRPDLLGILYSPSPPAPMVSSPPALLPVSYPATTPIAFPPKPNRRNHPSLDGNTLRAFTATAAHSRPQIKNSYCTEKTPPRTAAAGATGQGHLEGQKRRGGRPTAKPAGEPPLRPCRNKNQKLRCGAAEPKRPVLYPLLPPAPSCCLSSSSRRARCRAAAGCAGRG